MICDNCDCGGYDCRNREPPLTAFALRRKPAPAEGLRAAWVARPGLGRSYTSRKADARRYPTREAAEADRCGNEIVVPIEEGQR